MAKPFFDLERLDPDSLRRVATILRDVGYTEEGIRDRLGLADLSQISLASYPYFLDYRLRRRTPLDLAIIVFMLQGVVTEEELGELFDAKIRKLLRESRILMAEKQSRTYRARVSLYPVADRLFFTDHRFTPHAWLKARVPRDPVMYLGADSYYLARSTVRRPIRNALDLCAGSGVHGILNAGSAERSVGVDINPRAVNFARLNAMLNDSWNAVFVEGDLFTPVAGERFDMITANPPFVPSPVYELAYRDGGPSGADVLRRIVATIPDYLAQDGVAQVVTHVAEREGEPYLERIRRWLGGANMNLHCLRLGEDDVVEYAEAQVRKTFGERYPSYANRLVEWITNLRSQRFRRVVGIVLTFQWNEEAPHPPWTQEDEGKPPVKDIASEVTRLLTAKRRMRRMKDLESLDGMRVGIPDGMLLIERRRPTGFGFETKDFRVLFQRATLSPELDIKPLVRDLLERVDNRSTVADVVKRLADDTGQDPSDIEDRCRRGFQVMFERGLVTLDEAESRPPTPVDDDAEGSHVPTASKVLASEDLADADDVFPTARIKVKSDTRHDDELPPPPGFGQSNDSLDPDAPAAQGPGHTVRGG